MSLRLHPEFGVNPTIAACAWCGKDKNEIALLGFNKGKLAPRRVMLDDEPCEECQKTMNKGITIVLKKSENGPRLAWAVAKEEAFLSLLKEDVRESVKKARRCEVDLGAWKSLGLEAPEGM